MASTVRDGFAYKTYHRFSELPFATINTGRKSSHIHSNNNVLVEEVKGKADYRNLGKCVSKSFKLLGDDLREKKSECVKEARILSQARQKHVIKLHMAYMLEVKDEDPRFYIIMERAERSVRPYLEANSMKRIPMTWFGCLLNAVDYIHSIGIRHRDIKPENILLIGERLVLADFGISQMGLGKTMPTTIPALARARTKQYCAPEVEGGSTRGRSADIFSLGAVFLEMLAASAEPKQIQKLAEVLDSSDSLANESPSYGTASDEIQVWMESLRQFLNEDSQRAILDQCRKMISVDREERPLSGDIVANLESKRSFRRCQCVQSSLTRLEQLMDACKKGNYATAQTFRSDTKILNSPGPIHQASSRGHVDIVEMLLEHCPATRHLEDFSDQTALHCAAGYGREAIVDKLLEQRPEEACRIRDVHGQTALHCAAAYETQEEADRIIDSLLDKGKSDAAAKDDEGRTALHFAARRGHFRIVSKLLRQDGVKVDEKDHKNRTALHFAAAKGSVDTVRLLLESGADFNSLDLQGSTAFHFICRTRGADNDHVGVMKLLLERTTKCGRSDKSRRTPLHFAAENGSVGLVKTLLENKEPDVYRKDSFAMTPLHYAASQKFSTKNCVEDYVEVVKQLVERMDSEDLSIADSQERTALHIAAKSGSSKIVELLVQKLPDQDINAEDISRSTPLHAAAKGYRSDGDYETVIR